MRTLLGDFGEVSVDEDGWRINRPAGFEEGLRAGLLRLSCKVAEDGRIGGIRLVCAFLLSRSANSRLLRISYFVAVYKTLKSLVLGIKFAISERLEQQTINSDHPVSVMSSVLPKEFIDSSAPFPPNPSIATCVLPSSESQEDKELVPC